MKIQKAFMPVAVAAILTACSAAPGAVAQNNQGTVSNARTITVTGEGRAVAAPDMAVISIGVQTEGKTAAAALRENSSAMTATIKQLRDLGVAEKDIQTSGLSVNPRYDYEQNRSAPPIVGYTAANTVTVRLRDLAKAGEVIDQSVQTGANSLGGISFTFAEPKPLYAQARRDAVAQAKGQAELLTEAAGVKLGRLMSIQDGYVRSPEPRPAMMRMEMASDSAVPISAGESTVTATVTLVYELN